MIDDEIICYSCYDYVKHFDSNKTSKDLDEVRRNFAISSIDVIHQKIKDNNSKSKIVEILNEIDLEKIDYNNLMFMSLALKFYYLSLLSPNVTTYFNKYLKEDFSLYEVKYYQDRHNILIELLENYLNPNINWRAYKHAFISERYSKTMMDKILRDGSIDSHDYYSFKIFTYEKFSSTKFNKWYKSFNKSEVDELDIIVVPTHISVEESLKAKLITYEDLVYDYIKDICNGSYLKIQPLNIFDFFEFKSTLRKCFINIGKNYLLTYNEPNNFFLSLFLDNIKEAQEMKNYDVICESLFMFYTVFSSFNFSNITYEHPDSGKPLLIKEINDVVSMYYTELHYRSVNNPPVRYDYKDWGFVVYIVSIPIILVVYADGPSQIKEREEAITKHFLERHPESNIKTYYLTPSLSEHDDVNKYGITSLLSFFWSVLNTGESFPKTVSLLCSKFTFDKLFKIIKKI